LRKSLAEVGIPHRTARHVRVRADSFSVGLVQVKVLKSSGDVFRVMETRRHRFQQGRQPDRSQQEQRGVNASHGPQIKAAIFRKQVVQFQSGRNQKQFGGPKRESQ